MQFHVPAMNENDVTCGRSEKGCALNGESGVVIIANGSHYYKIFIRGASQITSQGQ